MQKPQLPNTLTILLGFGGSGGKTIAELADLLTNNPDSARFAHERIHVILCDTDEGDLRLSSERIRTSFERDAPGLSLQVETFSLSANTDVFCDLVQSKISRMTPEGIARMRDHWWFNGPIPFSAKGLPVPANLGAGQCPLVAQFLAWEKLSKFPAVLEKIDAYARNERHMEDFSVDLVLVSSLAGGTGRGCWQTLSFKAREHFGRSGQACRPYGFFFDQSVFTNVQRGSPEQKIKLRINSLTGLSELAMWLRSDRRMPGDPPPTEATPPERRFRLPDLSQPENTQIDALDTDRYIPEGHLARVGRSPIHKAFVFTNQSSSMDLNHCDKVYPLCAAAIYGRIIVTQTRSTDANQPSRAAATATSILYVPTSRIRGVILAAAKAERARSILEGGLGAERVVSFEKDIPTIHSETLRGKQAMLAQWLQKLLEIPTADDLAFNALGNIVGTQSVAMKLAGLLSEADTSDATEELRRALVSGDAGAVQEQLQQSMTPESESARNDFTTALQRALGINEDRWESLRKEAKSAKQDVLGVLARELLQHLCSGHANSILKTTKDSGGAVGAAYAVVLEIYRVVAELRHSCDSKLGHAERDAVNPAGAILADYTKSVRGVRKIPMMGRAFSAISSRKQRAILAALSSARRTVLLPSVLKQYAAFLEQLATAVDQWKLRSQDATKTIQTRANELNKLVKKDIERCFTKTDTGANGRRSADALLARLQLEESAPESRVVRALRPVFIKNDFDETVRATIAERRNITADQELFVEQLLGRDGSSLTDEGSMLFALPRNSITERQRFRTSVQRQLEDILAKQDAPEGAVRSFMLPQVLSDLMRLWIEVYHANQGDEAFARELDEAVEKITGISIRELQKKAVDNDIVFPEPEILLAHAALKLGEKCDPLVRLPAKTIGGSAGDLVTIFLPDHPDGSGVVKGAKQEIDQRWEKWNDQFGHVQVTARSSDPYMLLAISDHPKKDFDSQGWTGWTSFDYWFLDTTLASWLSDVEDPGGRSVFLEGKDDSIGLAYIHPSFVRDSHWARRRWRPWFNENRQKTQDRRKWEALAYALLGNDMYPLNGEAASDSELPFLKGYKEVCAAIKAWAPVNPDYPMEAWSLPLMKETPGDGGPAFTRRMFSSGAGGIRLNGEDLTRAAFSGSVRGWMEWFKSDQSREVLNAMWDEQCIFGSLITQRESSLYDVLSAEHRQNVRKTLCEFVLRWKAYIQKHTRRADDAEEQTKFLEEFERIISDSNFDVLKSFDGATILE